MYIIGLSLVCVVLSSQLYLVDKTDVSWWSMQSKSSGDTGLVPVNYIDKLDTDQEQKANNGTDGHTPSAQTNGGIDDQV